MSRADAFDAFYRESRERLLDQVYAYAGVTEVARRALDDAYASAAQHWRSVAGEADRDAWVRVRAFKATARRRSRSREPWYVSAKSTADEHRRLLATLASMSPADRHLLIARHLAGLDDSAAAREAGLDERAARARLDALTLAFATAGVDMSAGCRPALESLRGDLGHEPVEEPDRLRRAGNRRRRYRVLLACVPALVLAIGEAALTIGDGTDQPSTAAAPTSDATPETAASSTPPPPEGPRLGRADLSTPSTLRSLAGSAAWTVDSTSADVGVTPLAGDCMASAPDDRTAEHFWTRTFSTGTAAAATATQTLVAASTPQAARAAYTAQLASIGGCEAGAHQIVAVKTLEGTGDRSTLMRVRYVDARGRVHSQDAAVGRSGSAVTAWVVDATGQPSVPPRVVVKLLADSVDTVCRVADGTCATRPYRATPVVPPPDEAARGFLSTVDLPVFEQIPQPWVATPPTRRQGNPAATACDQADFVGAGATSPAVRSYVVPGARRLPDVFGMTETVATFPSRRDALAFVDSVATAVDACPSADLTLAVPTGTQIDLDRGQGFAWRIDQRTSKTTTIVFRVAILRVGTTVAQVTFTPGGGFDVGQAGFVRLATRAAQRLTQR